MNVRDDQPGDELNPSTPYREAVLIRFRVLGAFECWSGEERIHVGGKQSVRILTALLAEAGRVLPVASLVDATWGPEAPPTSSHQVRKIIADLRRRIPGGADLIATDGPGYRVDPARMDLDLARFHRHVAAGRDLVATDPAEAVREFGAALALWAPILAGSGGEVIEAMSQLVHIRVIAVAESTMELRLAIEPPAAIIADLSDLVHREPLVEGLRAQLIRALYLAGRQAEALHQYDTVRHLLADELGVDPGPALRTAYHGVLANDDEALRASVPRGQQHARLSTSDAGDRTTPTGPPAATFDQPGGPSTLPRRLRDFVARADETATVLGALEGADPRDANVVVLHGPAGVGKSALGLHLAHELTDRFPDGQLFVQMPSSEGDHTGTLAAVLEQLFLALGLPPDEIPAGLAARVDRWRTLISRRTMLLLLDDVFDPGDAHALLLSGPGSLTLVTGRTHLSDLEDAVAVALEPLPVADAVELLRRIVGTPRIDAEIEAAHDLARLCGGIPLVIRVVAVQLRRGAAESVGSFLVRLMDEGRHLEDFSERGRSLAGGFRLSICALPPDRHDILESLAWMPWGGLPVTRAAAAAWVGRPLADLQVALDDLIDCHLLESRDGVLLEMHDLLRDYLRRGQASDAAGLDAARTRVSRYLLAGVLAAADVLAPSRRQLEGVPDVTAIEVPKLVTPAQARRWFVNHDPLLGAALRGMTRPEDVPFVLHIVRGYAVHLLETGLASTGQSVCELAVAAARQIGDRPIERLSLSNLAVFQWRAGRTKEAIVTLSLALGIAADTGDTRGRSVLLSRLGAFRVAAGQLVLGCTSLEEALAGFDENMTRERASALSSLSSAYLRRGLLDRADECALESLALDDGALNAGLCHLHLASHFEARQDMEQALTHLRRSLAAYELLPGEDRLGVTHAHLAWVQARRDDPAAHEHYRRAELALESMPTLQRATMENLLAAADTALGDAASARSRHERAVACASALDQDYEVAVALDGLAHDELVLGALPRSMAYHARAEAEFDRMQASSQWFRSPPESA